MTLPTLLPTKLLRRLRLQLVVVFAAAAAASPSVSGASLPAGSEVWERPGVEDVVVVVDVAEAVVGAMPPQATDLAPL